MNWQTNQNFFKYFKQNLFYFFYFSDVRAARDQMNIGGLPYPTLPLHEAPARATSLFSQPSSACSSTTSFNGPFNSGVLSPQPHSSYYSGMTGPQHPFYNRVNNREPINILLIESGNTADVIYKIVKDACRFYLGMEKSPKVGIFHST